MLTRSEHTQDSTTRNSHVCAVQLSPSFRLVHAGRATGALCPLRPLPLPPLRWIVRFTASFFFSVKEETPWTWEAAYGLDEYIEGTVVYLDTVLLEESCSFAPNEEVSARSFLLARAANLCHVGSLPDSWMLRLHTFAVHTRGSMKRESSVIISFVCPTPQLQVLQGSQERDSV